jgi:hypothetical protein
VKRIFLTGARKIDSIFDLDDAMKVQTQGDRVVAIDEAPRRYDAVDLSCLSVLAKSLITSSDLN